MITNIFQDLWNDIVEISNKFYDYVMTNYEDPLLWLVIFAVLLVIAFVAISKLGDK